MIPLAVAPWRIDLLVVCKPTPGLGTTHKDWTQNRGVESHLLTGQGQGRINEHVTHSVNRGSIVPFFYIGLCRFHTSKVVLHRSNCATLMTCLEMYKSTSGVSTKRRNAGVNSGCLQPFMSFHYRLQEGTYHS